MLQCYIKVPLVTDVQLQLILATEPEILEPTYHRELKTLMDTCPSKRWRDKWLTKNGKSQFSETGLYGIFTKETILTIHRELCAKGLASLNQLETWSVNAGLLTLNYQVDIER